MKEKLSDTQETVSPPSTNMKQKRREHGGKKISNKILEENISSPKEIWGLQMRYNRELE